MLGTFLKMNWETGAAPYSARSLKMALLGVSPRFQILSPIFFWRTISCQYCLQTQDLPKTSVERKMYWSWYTSTPDKKTLKHELQQDWMNKLSVKKYFLHCQCSTEYSESEVQRKFRLSAVLDRNVHHLTFTSFLSSYFEGLIWIFMIWLRMK